jgi:hypothetical protein
MWEVAVLINLLAIHAIWYLPTEIDENNEET